MAPLWRACPSSQQSGCALSLSVGAASVKRGVTDQRGRIARVSVTGHVRTFSQGLTAHSKPATITAGPDGNIWFTGVAGRRIGRITPDGHVTVYRVQDQPVA